MISLTPQNSRRAAVERAQREAAIKRDAIAEQAPLRVYDTEPHRQPPVPSWLKGRV